MKVSANSFHAGAGFLSSSLRTQRTGVEGAAIWFFAAEVGRIGAHHGPRIQVALGEGLGVTGLAHSVPVLLTKPPALLGALPSGMETQVVEFVNRNRDTVLRHWRGEIDAGDVIGLIRPV